MDTRNHKECEACEGDGFVPSDDSAAWIKFGETKCCPDCKGSGFIMEHEMERTALEMIQLWALEGIHTVKTAEELRDLLSKIEAQATQALICGEG
jgi:hypothetical protein